MNLENLLYQTIKQGKKYKNRVKIPSLLSSNECGRRMLQVIQDAS
jgi:hypothetical protein